VIKPSQQEFERLAQQLSSGLILGLIQVIFAVSYAALMFSGRLSPYMAYAMTVTLITAAAGGLYGLFSQEPTFVSGPESGTSSVLAGVMVALAAMPASGTPPLHAALAVLLVASLSTALTYLLIVRFGATRLVRFIPFQVMAGFLASTGWLMASGALNIIAGTPLSVDGLSALMEHPRRPELAVGLLLVAVLAMLIRRFGAALAIPLFVVATTLAVNLVVRQLCPASPSCSPERWFFPPFGHLEWLPPWQLQLDGVMGRELLRLLPSFFAVAFVGTLTVLLSLSSLELTYRSDFQLEPALRLHGRMTLLTAALGGYLCVISIGRSTMSHQTGGGRWSCLVIAGACLAVLFGFGGLMAWIPKVALGALVLWIGLDLLRQWLWDLRRELSRIDLAQVVAILVCVIVFGYVVGFLAGLLAACIFFVVNYSHLPYIRLDTTLATARSSVIRDVADQQYLSEAGAACRIGRFEGFIFFGVANSIYEWYRAAPQGRFPVLVLDFSHAKGIDQSAVAVLQKIVRNEAAHHQHLILALGDAIQPLFRPAASPQQGGPAITRGFDEALERAEEMLLQRRAANAPTDGAAGTNPLKFLETAQDQRDFAAFLADVRLNPGDTLFEEGQACDDTYFVESGRLDVVKMGVHQVPVRLAKVVAGSMLGEIALYSGRPRGASVIAVEPALLRMLTREQWLRMKQDRPDLASRFDRHVILSLANTVGRVNATLSLQED
jgi:SulP family sulfate permease